MRVSQVATGGRPWRLEIPGAELSITSDEAFHLEALPGWVVVVGGGHGDVCHGQSAQYTRVGTSNLTR